MRVLEMCVVGHFEHEDKAKQTESGSVDDIRGASDLAASENFLKLRTALKRGWSVEYLEFNPRVLDFVQ